MDYINVDNEDYSAVERTRPFKPTKEQQETIEGLGKTLELQKYNVSLLYGVTGSRENRGVLKINTKLYRHGKDCHSASARNCANYSN